MIKIRHSWKKLFGTGKLKHAKCTNIGCGLQKYWDSNFGRLVYMDRFGNLLFKTPSCKLPD